MTNKFNVRFSLGKPRIILSRNSKIVRIKELQKSLGLPKDASTFLKVYLERTKISIVIYEKREKQNSFFYIKPRPLPTVQNGGCMIKSEERFPKIQFQRFPKYIAIKT